jgi:hypothetical protein
MRSRAVDSSKRVEFAFGGEGLAHDLVVIAVSHNINRLD